jgi:regulatory protein
LLARREHSTSELTRKLRSKQFDRDDIQTALQILNNEGLLNDGRFTECYIHFRRQKGYGPLRIHSELIERGITEDMIEHHLNITDNAWFTVARRTWQKRFKGIIPRDLKTRIQQMRFLQYRGFTQEQIKTIFHSDTELCQE